MTAVFRPAHRVRPILLVTASVGRGHDDAALRAQPARVGREQSIFGIPGWILGVRATRAVITAVVV